MNVVMLKCSIKGLTPVPWREVKVAPSMTFSELHHLLILLFEFQSGYLWEFVVGDSVVRADSSSLHADMEDAEQFTIKDVVDLKCERFKCTLVQRGIWNVSVEVGDITEVEVLPRLPNFVGGEFASPPEELYSTRKYQKFLDAIDDPSHRNHSWAKKLVDGAEFENEIDEGSIRDSIQKQPSIRLKPADHPDMVRITQGLLAIIYPGKKGRPAKEYSDGELLANLVGEFKQYSNEQLGIQLTDKQVVIFFGDIRKWSEGVNSREFDVDAFRSDLNFLPNLDVVQLKGLLVKISKGRALAKERQIRKNSLD